MKLENDLGKDDIKQLVLRLALPAMAAQLVNILYSIVDRIYVGNIAGIGEAALAAVGVCAPIITLVGSFSCLVGVGGAPLMSIKLGENDEEGAKKIIANSFMLLIGISTLLTIFVLLFKKQILFSFGSSAEIYPYANQYFTIYILGTVFALLSTGMNQFIMCQGYAKVAMKSVIIGALFNIVLDPIFIFALKMNVAGAALATIISQFFACVYVLKFLFRKDVPVNITFEGYSLQIVKKILTIGFNPFVIIATDNVLLIAMNITLQKYGGNMGDTLLACSTILQSFMSMVTMPLMGITTGTQPILSYNYGARNSKRVMTAAKYTLFLSFAFTTLMFIVAHTIPEQFSKVFTSNEEYIRIAAQAIRIYTWGLIPMAAQYTFVDAFTGVGAVRVSIVVSLFRKAIFLLCILLIPKFFHVMGIFYAEPISDLIGGIFSSTMFCIFMPKLLAQRENQALA